MSSDSIPD